MTDVKPKQADEPKPYDFEGCKTRRNQNGKYFETDVVAAIYYTGGLFGEMASLLGRTRRGVKEHIERNPELQTLIEEVRESKLDAVEKGLFDLAIIAHDGPSQRFLLQTLGKDRGYTTRHEVSGPGGGPIETTIDPEKLDNKTLAAIMAARKRKDSDHGDK